MWSKGKTDSMCQCLFLSDVIPSPEVLIALYSLEIQKVLLCLCGNMPKFIQEAKIAFPL